MALIPDNDFEISPFFEITPDLVCIAGKDGYFRKVNPAVVTKLEYSREELFSKPIASFIHPEDQPLTAAQRKKLIEGTPLINFQNRYLTKTGKVIWLHWTSIYLPEREVVFAIAKDVTERKVMELEIEEKYRKFKNLATHFKSAAEKDRNYVAFELHEQLAQLASVIKMDIDWMSSRALSLEGIDKKRMDHAAAATEVMIQTIRRLSFFLGPNTLQDIGFIETMNWLCREFSILNGANCSFNSHLPETDLSEELKTDFFRICQEVLFHLCSSDHVSRVQIRIDRSAERICLSIQDNGKPFNLDKLQPNVTAISERVLSFNGMLKIEYQEASGNHIKVTAPVK